jgi:hypothetical protein
MRAFALSRLKIVPRGSFASPLSLFLLLARNLELVEALTTQRHSMPPPPPRATVATSRLALRPGDGAGDQPNARRGYFDGRSDRSDDDRDAAAARDGGGGEARCASCAGAVATVRLAPCGHLCLCQRHWASLEARAGASARQAECPVCNELVQRGDF